jgi:hypothetical protein
MEPNDLANGPGTLDILDLRLGMARAMGPRVIALHSRALLNRPDQPDTLAGFSGPALVLGETEDPAGAAVAACRCSRRRAPSDAGTTIRNRRGNSPLAKGLTQ